LFAKKHGYPVILKPDHGRIGFGIYILNSTTEARSALRLLNEDYILEAFSDKPLEFGVFYVKRHGIPSILSINSKEFPHVIGDGKHSIRELVSKNKQLDRFRDVITWEDDTIPTKGRKVHLSKIGSHTQGATFYDVTHLKTKALIAAVHDAVGIPGFNYGRLDVRARNIKAFQQGTFDIIEVNGMGSLSTNAFDPSYSFLKAQRVFLKQFRALWEIAYEHRNKRMMLPPLRTFLRKVKSAEKKLHSGQRTSTRYR